MFMNEPIGASFPRQRIMKGLLLSMIDKDRLSKQQSLNFEQMIQKNSCLFAS